ncbi:MAG: cation transporter [Patescibacteria group bacterium]
MKTTKTYQIAGMHCASCAMLIEGELEDRGIIGRCSFAKQTLEVDTEDAEAVDMTVEDAVTAAGYRVEK